MDALQLVGREAELTAIDAALEVRNPDGWILSRQGIALARFGPKRVPDVEWPQPLKVLTPAEGGDGREMPRVAAHS